jgi:hypothetical protein
MMASKILAKIFISVLRAGPGNLDRTLSGVSA